MFNFYLNSSNYIYAPTIESLSNNCFCLFDIFFHFLSYILKNYFLKFVIIDFILSLFWFSLCIFNFRNFHTVLMYDFLNSLWTYTLKILRTLCILFRLFSYNSRILGNSLSEKSKNFYIFLTSFSNSFLIFLYLSF